MQGFQVLGEKDSCRASQGTNNIINAVYDDTVAGRHRAAHVFFGLQMLGRFQASRGGLSSLSSSSSSSSFPSRRKSEKTHSHREACRCVGDFRALFSLQWGARVDATGTSISDIRPLASRTQVPARVLSFSSL